jgi:hypothetical protein
MTSVGLARQFRKNGRGFQPRKLRRPAATRIALNFEMPAGRRQARGETGKRSANRARTGNPGRCFVHLSDRSSPMSSIHFSYRSRHERLRTTGRPSASSARELSGEYIFRPSRASPEFNPSRIGLVFSIGSTTRNRFRRSGAVISPRNMTAQDSCGSGNPSASRATEGRMGLRPTRYRSSDRGTCCHGRL